LLTSVASPTLFTLDPNGTNGTLAEVHTFANASSLSGITEYLPDIFSVASSLIGLATRRAVSGSTVIWSVDFNQPAQACGPRQRPSPGNASVNGLASYRHSGYPHLRRCHPRTGELRLVIQDASMLPNAPPSALGISGLHVRDTSIFFTNFAQGKLHCR
ncbi:hypothetical protein C8R47DRAFT_958051, partial [Mycena vitilis]